MPKAVNVVNEKTLVKATLNDVEVLFSVDSGSTVNLVDEKDLKKFSPCQIVRLN